MCVFATASVHLDGGFKAPGSHQSETSREQRPSLMLLFATFVAFKINISRVDNYTFPRVLCF